MPAFSGCDHNRGPLLRAERSHGFGLGLRQSLSLNALALAIEPIELTRKPHAFGRIRCHEKIDPEGGTADPAAGVYPRAQKEAEVPRLRRPSKPSDVHQGGEAGILAASQRQQPFGDKGAVEALERHYISDRSQRDQVEKPQEIQFWALYRPKLPSAKLAVERN